MKKTAQIICQCLIIVVILFCKTSLFAQNGMATNSQIRKADKFFSLKQNVIHPFTIGDKVADITVENIINYASQTINLSAFKGKLVILVIRTSNDDKLITTKGGKPDNNLDSNDSVKSLTNFWFSELSGFLQTQNEILYVFDEIGIPYNKNVDLRKELERYCLDLTCRKRNGNVCDN